DPSSRIDVPLRFPGHYADPEIGLYYNRFRFYSPELGRYTQSDPVGIGAGLNVYAYPANPLAQADDRGECPPGDPPKGKGVKIIGVSSFFHRRENRCRFLPKYELTPRRARARLGDPACPAIRDPGGLELPIDRRLPAGR